MLERKIDLSVNFESLNLESLNLEPLNLESLNLDFRNSGGISGSGIAEPAISESAISESGIQPERASVALLPRFVFTCLCVSSHVEEPCSEIFRPHCVCGT